VVFAVGVVSPDDAYRKDFITYADILFFSAANYDDPAPLIHQFMENAPTRIVISGMGARGCALGTHGRITYFAPVEYEQPVIDTNGAGDELAVGFLSSYVLDGYSLEDSIVRGQIAARHKCTRKADSSHLISRAKLDAEFARLKK
jgi:sugar/nucleoside kinase (ribokinase family)